MWPFNKRTEYSLSNWCAWRFSVVPFMHTDPIWIYQCHDLPLLL